MEKPLTLDQLQQTIMALNETAAPAKYSVAGSVITGTLDMDKHAEGIVSSSSVQDHFTITITLDEASHTFQYNEVSTSDQQTRGLTSMSGSHSWGSGKQYHKQFGMADLLAKNSGTADAAKYTATFDSSKVTKPVLNALAAAGWKKQVGFFGRLFGKK